MTNDGVSRRHFFFGALLAGAVSTGGWGSVPSLRALGYKPFYDKLNVGAIGCGGQGGVDLNDAARTENIVALCDVDETRAATNFQRFDKAPKYKVTTQMGNQGYSHESIRTAAEIVWSGAIGDVAEVHVSASPGTHPTGLQEPPR